MKSLIQSAVAVAAVFVGTTGVAMANLNVVPEPGSLALVGIALAGVALVARKGKK
jgi:hypothetical protein